MSGQQSRQVLPGDPNLAGQVDDSRIRQAERLGFWPSDWPLPSIVSDGVLRLVLGISWASFYRYKKARRFDVFKTKVSLSGSAEYSGLLVDQLRRGESPYPVPGRRLAKVG